MRTALLLLFGIAAHAAEFRVSAGLTDQQVFQRNGQNTAEIKVAGTADGLAGKQIEARVLSGAKAVRGWAWKSIATVDGATWTGALSGVPMGGPYNIEFRSAGATPVVVKDVLVGDLWILAGQSNMEGVGDLENVQPPDPRVHSFDQLDRWFLAQEPLHNLVGAVDRVHWRGNPPTRVTGQELETYNKERKKGAGLGLPFAAEMVRRTGVPVGLIPCAHGGTSMAQWDPALKDKRGDSLYGAMVRRFEAIGGKAAGVLWYQGEAEANAKAAPIFANKFEDFVAAVRRDFAQPDLPFYYVQIGRYVSPASGREWNAVQEAQRVLGDKIPKSGVVSAIDFSLDDVIHVSTPSQKRLGVRLANLATGKAKSPNVVSAHYQPTNGAFGLINVKFANVTGKLQADGRVSGFGLYTPAGEWIPAIFRADVDPSDGSTVLLHVNGKIPEDAALYYGYGRDPYCNLRDEADMGVLVFGPLPLNR
jgi:sialate O-acetylesterase